METGFVNRRHQRSRSPSVVCQIALLISLSIGVVAIAQVKSSEAPLENRIKAAFLVKFFSFVDWPPNALPAAGDQVVIGVVGTGPTLSALLSLQGTKVEDKQLVVKHLAGTGDFRSCHILFFSEDSGVNTGRVLGEIADAAVLTVGETRDFTGVGGMVRFFVDAKKVRFEINTEAVGNTGLKVSSHLLRLATIADNNEGR